MIGFGLKFFLFAPLRWGRRRQRRGARARARRVGGMILSADAGDEAGSIITLHITRELFSICKYAATIVPH